MMNIIKLNTKGVEMKFRIRDNEEKYLLVVLVIIFGVTFMDGWITSSIEVGVGHVMAVAFVIAVIIGFFIGIREMLS